MSEPTVDKSSAIAAAVCISFISVGGFLILPLLVGAAATDMALSAQQLGFLASGVMAGSALSSVLAVFWIRRVDWRTAGYCALALLLAAHAISLFVDDLLLFTLCQCLAGMGGGAAYSLALTALSDGKHPDRNFAFSITAQVSFQVVGLMALPAVIQRFGLNGVLGILVLLECAGLILMRWIPRTGAQTSHLPIGRALFKPRVLAALAGCGFFFFNIGAVWTYVERMGVAAQFEPGFIGISLAAGVSVGIPGALLAAWCGDRYGRIMPLALGALGTVLALAMMTDGMSKSAFVAALALYNFVWNFSLPFQYSTVSAADDSGRCIAAAPAFHAAGGAIGPAVVALYLGAGSFNAVNMFAGAAVMLSLLMFVLAINRHGNLKSATT